MTGRGRLTISTPITVWVGPLLVEELKRIVKESEITKYVGDLAIALLLLPLNLASRSQGRRRSVAKEEHCWKARVGDPNRQRTHRIRGECYRSIWDDMNHADHFGGIAQTAKIGSLADVTDSADPEGLRVFYYLVQDLKVCKTPDHWDGYGKCGNLT
jgi:hypothetical protein